MEGLTYFLHLFHSGGIVMYPLLALSIFTVAIAIERFCYYKANRKDSKRFFTGIAHGVSRRNSEKEMKDAFNEQMTVESVAFRRYLDYLSAIVTVAPLLGLLGTVTGMISTFSVLDNGAGASAITGGVGEALVATASGLCVAIIAFCVYTYFDHQLDTIVTDTEKLCVSVVNANNAK